MSTPDNELNAFRTYAYHHILFVCDGTLTGQALAESFEVSLFDHNKGRWQIQKISNTACSSGNYIVLINGLSDVQFYISSVNWTSYLLPNFVMASQAKNRTQETVGVLKIVEPLGVNFLNLLNDSFKKLGTDATAVCWGLKTIFVGHRHDGVIETKSHYRSLLFTPSSVSAMFNETGAEYEIPFVATVGGAANLSHFVGLADNISVRVKGETIGKALKDLQTRINNKYDQNKNELIKQAECSGSTINFKEEFYDVRLRIDVDNHYAGMTVGGNSLPHQQTTGDNDATHKQSGDSRSILELISQIMESSEDVVKEQQGSFDSANKGELYQYRVTNHIESCLGEHFTLVYAVHRWKATLVFPENFQTFEPNPDDQITFDYIFTGKNVDILELDLKMNLAIAFLQVVGVTSSLPNNSSETVGHKITSIFSSGTGNKEGPGDQQFDPSSSGNFRKKPLMPITTVKSSTFRNNRNPGATTNYLSQFQRFVALENSIIRITIRGNPTFLDYTAQFPSDMDPNNPFSASIFPPSFKSPAYAKVNVFMPTDWLSGVDSSDYSTLFWYNGWYHILSVENIFEHGEFKQELELYIVPTNASQHRIGSDDACANPSNDMGGAEGTEGSCPSETTTSGTGGTGGFTRTGDQIQLTGTGQEKGVQVARELTKQGFNEAQAAGIVGNMMIETGEFKHHQQLDSALGSGGIGWLQWTGSRRNNYENWAASKHLDVRSDEANMGFLVYEMSGSTGNHWTKGYSLAEYKTIQDPQKATDYFMKGYERPSEPHASKRQAYGDAIAKKLGTINSEQQTVEQPKGAGATVEDSTAITDQIVGTTSSDMGSGFVLVCSRRGQIKRSSDVKGTGTPKASTDIPSEIVSDAQNRRSVAARVRTKIGPITASAGSSESTTSETKVGTEKEGFTTLRKGSDSDNKQTSWDEVTVKNRSSTTEWVKDSDGRVWTVKNRKTEKIS